MTPKRIGSVAASRKPRGATKLLQTSAKNSRPFANEQPGTVQPIRLGGKSVLSLDAINLLALQPTGWEYCSPALVTNLPDILLSIGFDEDEILYLHETEIEGTPISQLYFRTGWMSSRVAAIRKSVAAKLIELASRDWGAGQYRAIEYSSGDSRYLGCKIRQHWELATLPAEVLAAEISKARERSMRYVHTGSTSKANERKLFMTKVTSLADLQAQRTAISLRVKDILQRAHDAEMEVRSAEVELEQLRAAVERDAEDCIIDERHRPDASLQKRISAAEQRLSKAAETSAAANRVLLKKSEELTAIEVQIVARRHEAFRLELGSAPIELRRLMMNLAEKAAEIDGIARKHGRNGHELTLALFPSGATPEDPYRNMDNVARAVGLFNTALGFVFRPGYEGKNTFLKDIA